METTTLSILAMTKLLFILLLLFGCEGLLDDFTNSVNYDHCDVFSEFSEDCIDIQLECEDVDGIYSIIDNEDYENNSACCCSYD